MPSKHERERFIFPGCRKWYKAYLAREHETGEPFSDEAVRVSLLLDIDDGKVRSQRDYHKIWGWSYKRARLQWQAIWEDVASVCVSDGRQMDHPFFERLPDEWKAFILAKYGGAQKGRTKGAKNKASNTKKADSGRTRGALGAQHTIHLHLSSISSDAYASSETCACGVHEDVWRDWIQFRDEIGHALTARAVTIQTNLLKSWADAGLDPNDAIIKSINSGWRGLFEPDAPARTSTRNNASPRRTAAERASTVTAKANLELLARQREKKRRGDDVSGNRG